MSNLAEDPAFLKFASDIAHNLFNQFGTADVPKQAIEEAVKQKLPESNLPISLDLFELGDVGIVILIGAIVKMVLDTMK